jgi:hypothetical protein
MGGNPCPADVRVRPRSQSELGTDRSQARVGRGARSTRARPAVNCPGAPLHSTKAAADVPSAGSQTFNHPPRDPADGATLGSLRTGGDSEGPRSRTPSSRQTTFEDPREGINPSPTKTSRNGIAGSGSPCHLERSGLRGRAVERSPDGTKRSFARGAPPDLWGSFDSFADSLAQDDMLNGLGSLRLQSRTDAKRPSTQSDPVPLPPRPLSSAMALRLCVLAPLRQCCDVCDGIRVDPRNPCPIYDACEVFAY